MARHAHVSGRFDADRQAFARYVALVVELSRATSLTTTETYRSLRPLRRALGGRSWIVTRRGEYVVAVRRDTYRRAPWTRRGALARLSRRYAGRHEWRDLFVHRRTFVHRTTGRPVLFIAAHAPSGIQAGDDWKPGSQAEASKAGLTRLGRAVARAEERRPRLAVVLGVDTNGDHHRQVWRERFESMLGVPSCWSDERPDDGTHGSRLIDAIYSTAPIGNGRIAGAARPPKVDHRGVVADVEL